MFVFLPPRPLSPPLLPPLASFLSRWFITVRASVRCARPCGSAAACDVACPDPELRERRRIAAGADAASVMTGAAERSLQVAVVLLYLVQLTAGTGTAGVMEGGEAGAMA